MLKNKSLKYISESSQIAMISFSLVTLVLSPLACCYLIYHLMGYGCFFWECAPKRNFTVYDLSLPSNLFPNGKPLPLQPDRGIVGAREQAIGTTSNLAIYEVLRFAAVTKAIDWYDNRIGHNIFMPTVNNLERYNIILDYQSKFADEFKVQCGYTSSSNFPHCIFQARYEEYYIFFNGSFGDNLLSGEDYLGVINYIDETMGKFLEKEEINP